jgi:hypothetical protein
MSNKLCHTDIPTAWLFGRKNAYSWNPIRGCNNFSCPSHPKNSGKCWAAQLCRFHAKPLAKSETDFITTNIKDMGIKLNYQKKLEKDLGEFKSQWFSRQFYKQFPNEQSCILVGYQTDLAYVPIEWTSRILGKIEENNREREAAGLPLHIFQFLTKEPSLYGNFPFPLNCWLGFTICNEEYQKKAADVLQYRQKPSNIIYAYMEPILENFDPWLLKRFDWVIVGGGPEPLNPDWVRSIKNQCQATGIPFYFKGFGKYEQDGAWNKPEWKNVIHKPPRFQKNSMLRRKKLTTLDGEKLEHFPEVKQ